MTNIHLTEQKCEACEGGVAPFTISEAAELLPQVPEWQIDETGKMLYRSYTCADFAAALALVNRAGEVAESEGHHPDIHLTNYKHVLIELTTHAIEGLSQNDFIVAAKIDAANTATK